MAKLVAIQMISGPDVDKNLNQLQQELTQIKVDQDTLVVLPECFACFGGGDKRALDLAENKGVGPIQDALCALAREFSVWLVAGAIPLKASTPGKFTASCLLIDAQGRIITEYQKIHLFDVEVKDNTRSYQESLYTQAGQHISVLDTPFGRLGLAVCYDVRFAGLFQAMGQLDILAIPAAFTKVTGAAHWHALLQARSIENQCYLVAADQGGIHANGRETYGHSLILSPWRESLAEIAVGQGTIQAEMDHQSIQDIRSSMPVHTHNQFRSYLVE